MIKKIIDWICRLFKKEKEVKPFQPQPIMKEIGKKKPSILLPVITKIKRYRINREGRRERKLARKRLKARRKRYAYCVKSFSKWGGIYDTKQSA